MAQLSNKFRDLLIGCAFFDSLGIGFETQTYEQVQDYIKHNPEWCRSVITPTTNPYFDVTKFEPGICTDDFQLTFAIAKSIISCKGINLDDIAKQHISEYFISTNGWGNGTKSSVKRLTEGTTPYESGSNESIGNGVLMKITPVGYYLVNSNHGFSSLDKIKLINEITSMTHNNDTSRIVTNLHVHLLEYLFTNNNINRQQFIDCCQSFKSQLDEYFPQVTIDSIYLATVRKIEKFCQQKNPNDQYFLAISNNASFHQIDTFNIIWSLILSKEINQQLPFEAIKLGGDTDTNGSILGSIVCVLIGSDWLQHLNPTLYNKLKRMNDINNLG